MNARYIIETEEWKVQPVADGASAETILANGMSAVKTGDLATAEKMAAMLTAKAGGPPAAGGGAHADHGAAPAPAAGGENPDAGKGDRVMALELAALVAEAKGQKDQAIALLTEAVKIEESMRPPRGAADPVKPSHEVLGEVLLRAGKAKEAAAAFDASLLLMPNRARALMGAAQAHAAAGNAAAAAARHATLMSVLEGQGAGGRRRRLRRPSAKGQRRPRRRDRPMGTWGTGILEDDLARDIYDQYLDAVDDGLTVEAIVGRLEAAHLADPQPGEDATFWLAVAQAQRDLGTLRPEVVQRVTDIVRSGRGLDAWAEAGAADLGRRKAALTRFLTSLSQPRPRTRPKRPSPAATPPPFEVGDLVAVALADGRHVGVVVTRALPHPKVPSLIVSVADVIQANVPDATAFAPLRWFILAPDQFPNLVVKFQVYADGYERHQNAISPDGPGAGRRGARAAGAASRHLGDLVETAARRAGAHSVALCVAGPRAVSDSHGVA